MLKKFFMISKDIAKNVAKVAKESDTLKGIARDATKLLKKAKDAAPIEIEIKLKKQK